MVLKKKRKKAAQYRRDFCFVLQYQKKKKTSPTRRPLVATLCFPMRPSVRTSVSWGQLHRLSCLSPSLSLARQHRPLDVKRTDYPLGKRDGQQSRQKQKIGRCGWKRKAAKTAEISFVQHKKHQLRHPEIRPTQNTKRHVGQPVLNIIRGVEICILPAQQLLEIRLVLNNQTLFVGQMQETNESETRADVG